MSDPKKAVKDYLSNNGFPFEMRVAKQFRQAGFETYQSMLYKDVESRKDREIDINAYYIRNYYDVQFSFKVTIECKYAKTPWILFTGENAGFSELNVHQLYCSNYAGDKILQALGRYPEWRNAFVVDKRLAYGITETAKKEGEEEGRNAYKALTTLLNALQYEKVAKPTHPKQFEIFIPIIAVQGKLFECYLSDSNEEVVNEIDEGQVLYKSNIYPGIFPIVNVVTEEKIPSLAKKVFDDFKRIYDEHYSDIGYLLNDYPSPIVAF